MDDFEGSMKLMAEEITTSFSGGRTCDINMGKKSYSPTTGSVSDVPDVVTVPYCSYGISQKFFKNQDFSKASAVLAVSGHHYGYDSEAVDIGGSVTLPNGSVRRIVAKSVDMYGILFELGIE